MSEQEMQFANPDWQPNRIGTLPQQAAPLPVNEPSLSNATPSQSANTSEYDYAGYAGVEYHEPVIEDHGVGGYAGKAGQSWKLARPQQRRRRSPWPWIVIIAIAVMLVGGMTQGYFMQGGFGRSDFGRHMTRYKPSGFNNPFTDGNKFTVGPNSTVTVTDPVSSIVVTSGGPPNVVLVQTNASDIGSNNNQAGPLAQMSQDASGNVSINIGPHPFGTVDVQLTVPDGINLVLQTTSGNINVNNVSGQFTLSSASGSITLNNVTLTQNSSIQTDSGAISFFGSLQPLGTYQMSSKSGAITAEMEGKGGQSYPYHLHATTSGELNINGPLPTPSTSDHTFDINRDFGADPKATLTIQSQTGNITLQSQ